MADAIATRKADLDKIMTEAEALQKKYEGKRWVPEDRAKFEALCSEGKTIQDEIDAETEFKALKRWSHEVPHPSLPNGKPPEEKNENGIAGYISVGDLVLMSEGFQEFAESGYATGKHAVIQMQGAYVGKNALHGPHGQPLIPVSRQQRKTFEDFLQTKEGKAVPTLGTGVIEPERLSRIPQVTADERMTIRDVISTGQTNSSAVEYVREEGVTGAAAPTAHGVGKPELAVEYTLQSAPVRTIAGWMPVQNQQIEDWAQLRSLLDGRLRYSVKRSEENQILYGTGTPPEIEGILEVDGTTNIAGNGRYNGAVHTLIDVVRLGITDVLVAGYQPNAVVLHPYDWETILLEKGSDDRYVWAVVTDDNGSRIWGLRAVESIGAQERSGAGTAARNIVVGDWQMGAQLLDRMQITVQVGLVNDQFVKNMRTILAEERIALAIYAPAAFAYFETQAES
jgi:HK97 family phage major capsid protein